jgi:hypothetical protein
VVLWIIGGEGRCQTHLSTKVGIITEGPTDEILLSALLERIARVRAGFNWPTIPDDLGEIVPVRKRGHGGVLDALRRIVSFLAANPPTNHAFFIILLDYRTEHVQAEVRRLIRGNEFFVLGISIHEIEAWWLADRRNTLTWLGLSAESNENLNYFQDGYSSERDPRPKATLDSLTLLSPHLDQRYGSGNTALARDFAGNIWKDYAELDAIENECVRGFRPFCHEVTEALLRERRRRERRA